MDYRLLFDKMMNGFAYHRVVLDEAGHPKDYVFLEANDAFESLTGLRREMIIGRRATEVLPGIERDPANWISRYGRVAITGEEDRFEQHSTALDRWYSVLAYRPEPGHFATVFEDVTARKRAEETRRESEERYRDTLDNISDLVHRVAPDGSLVYANRIWCETLGYTEDEVHGLSFLDVIHPDSLEHCQALFPEMLKSEGTTPIKVWLRAKDGQAVLAEGTANCRFEAGRPVGLYCILRDVTERRRTREALALSEERRESIIASAPVGMHLYELDADGRLVLAGANPAANTVLGVDNSQFIGLAIEEAFPDLASTELPERYRQTAVTGKPWRAEHTTYDDGQVVGVQHVHAFRISPGRIAVFFEDLTATKQAAEQKRNLEEQLRQAQKMEAIGRLAGGIAHDFNNMVAVITMNAQLALGNLPADHPVRGDLEEINDAAQRAADLTRQLLAFGRRQIIAPRVISLNESVGGIEKMLRRLLGEDIELRAHLASELALVKVDPSQVEQIIMNLAVNARHAMPRGGALTIETANVDLDENYAETHADARTGPHVMLAVSDTGSGMDSETVAQIFEPFFTTKEQGKGTGLGLSTVYGIVKQSGGNIWVYSEPGKGTTFKIYLPIAEAEGERPRPAPRRETPSRGGETILLAEDDGALMRAMARMLAKAGYHVLEANSGDEALGMCRDHDGAIDLLLTDVVMPKMGGKELAEWIRQLRPSTKVLFSSGYTDNGIAHHGVLESGVAFLQKPFTVDSLLNKVRDVIDGEER